MNARIFQVSKGSGQRIVHSAANVLRFRYIQRIAYCCWLRIDKLIQLLLDEHPDADVRDNYENRALHEAACNGHLEATSALVKRGAAVDSRDVDDTTPIHLAVSFAHEELILKLLKHGADPNAVCLDGWNHLHEAADKGHISIVSLLLDVAKYIPK